MEFELAPFALAEGYGESVLPLADAKRHLSIEADETEFDELISALRDAAVDMTERYTGVILAPRVGMVWMAEGQPCGPVRLGVRPVTEITEASYLDGQNAVQAIDVATLRIGLHGAVVPVPGATWPSGIRAALTLTFDAGHTDDTRPAALVAAAKLFLAHLHSNREAVVTGTISGEIPLGFKTACRAYRLPVI